MKELSFYFFLIISRTKENGQQQDNSNTPVPRQSFDAKGMLK